MIVEPEVGGIQEHHFADRGLQDHALVDKSYAKLLRRRRDQLSIVKKDFCGREAVGLQDKLALQILNLIERMAVTILALFEVSAGSRPRSILWHVVLTTSLEPTRIALKRINRRDQRDGNEHRQQ